MDIDRTTYKSENFGRRIGSDVSLLVLHYTAMEKDAPEYLCAPTSKVSAHYYIDRRGKIFQLVDEKYRAWHAGVSYWRGVKDINSHSIGIELDYHPNLGSSDFVERPPNEMPSYPAPLMTSLRALALDLVTRHNIEPCNVIAHSDIAPSRKYDPGAAFDWETLGVGALCTNVVTDNRLRKLVFGTRGDAVHSLQKKLKAYGYHVAVDGDYGNETMCVIKAFQRHYRRSQIDGIADAQTRSYIEYLYRTYP